MRDKEIKELFDRELEKTFHMNEKADYSKRNLVFTKRDPRIFVFNKAKFLTFSTLFILALIGISSTVTYAINQHINEELIKNKYNNGNKVNNIINEADEYLDGLNINFSELPIVTKNIDSKYYLNIYEGFEYTSDNSKNILYFYQFGCYDDMAFNMKLDFYIEPNNYQTEILSQKNIAQLTINNSKELSSLYVDVYKDNQLLTKLTLI